MGKAYEILKEETSEKVKLIKPFCSVSGLLPYSCYEVLKNNLGN
jgi:hypothetical protein